MPKGKAPQSEQVKAAYEAYCSMSPSDQTIFQSKLFTTFCNGLTPIQRKEVKKERDALWDKIEGLKTVNRKMKDLSEILSHIPTEALKKALEEKENQK